MKKIILVLAVFALPLFFSIPAEAVVHVEARYWFTTLDSKIKVTDSALIGTEIDVVDTLGMDDKKNFGEARIDLNLGDHHLRYSYLSLSWDGDKTVTQSIDFAGQTYTAGLQVTSKLDITYQRLGYRYDIINTLGNQLGIIFDIKLFDIDAHLRQPATGIDESRSITAPIPTIGLGAQIGLPFLFSVSAEVTGIGYNDNHLIDGEAQVNFDPVPFTTISGGYRIFDTKIKDGDDKADFSLKGPFLMVRVGF